MRKLNIKICDFIQIFKHNNNAISKKPFSVKMQERMSKFLKLTPRKFH